MNARIDLRAMRNLVRQQRREIQSLEEKIAGLKEQLRRAGERVAEFQPLRAKLLGRLTEVPHALPSCSPHYAVNPFACAACAALKEIQ